MRSSQSGHHLDWMRPVERNLPNGRCDYYVALPAEAELLETLAVPKSATD
jgi:hypothetical protein